MELLDNVLLILAGLTGLGAFISILVNVLKLIGVVKDGTSAQWVQALNFIAFVAVAVIVWLGKPVSWDGINSILAGLASIIGLITQMIGSKVFYNLFAGTPVIGYSYTNHKTE